MNWQDFFDEYCLNELGGRKPQGREYDAACAYADECMANVEAEANRYQKEIEL